LEIREKALGSAHPDVAGSLNNLASLYQDQGKYDTSEPLYKRALEINEKALGSAHPGVAASLNNLVLLYKAEGKYDDTEPLLKRALEIKFAYIFFFIGFIIPGLDYRQDIYSFSSFSGKIVMLPG
jgi:tetratricopeptide (TPR) repeat protein